MRNIHEENWINHFLLYRPVWIRWLSVMEGSTTRLSTKTRQGWRVGFASTDY
jgi:hypothetical protein